MSRLASVFSWFKVEKVCPSLPASAACSPQLSIYLFQFLYIKILKYITDIEQVLKEKKPFILSCRPSDLKVMQGRSPAWNRCALNA
jgi:hypothetical protein